MFVENGGNVQNWLGKFGAYSSHKLMYNTLVYHLSHFALYFFFMDFEYYLMLNFFSLNPIP